jgi:phage-related protein
VVGNVLTRQSERATVQGELARPIPAIGRQCHELRIIDHDQAWRIVYHVARDAIVILEVFSKKTQTTPVQIVEVCQKRLAVYLRAISDKEYT